MGGFKTRFKKSSTAQRGVIEKFEKSVLDLPLGNHCRFKKFWRENARVTRRLPCGTSCALAPPTAEIRAEIRRAGTAVLDEARQALRGDVEVAQGLCEGHTRPALIAACEKYGLAVLVVGSRGLGGFKGLLLGSTSRWVLNHAACPVVVARRPTSTH